MQAFSSLLLDLYGSARACPVDEFNDHCLARINDILHFDSATVLSAAPTEGRSLAVQDLYVCNQPLEKLSAHESLATPDYVLIDAIRRRGQCVTADSRDVFHGHPDFLDYCRRFEVAQTLVLVPPSRGTNRVDLLSLWRAGRGDAYTPDEARLGNLLLPHFFQAREINLRLSAAGAAPAAISLIANQQGCLYFSDADTVRLLQREWKQWRPHMLPAELLDALRGNPQRRYVGRTMVANASLQGTLLYIHVVPHDPGRGLTKAERQVAWLAAEGMSYKDIAKRLDRSPATIRNQLHSVYAKFGVSNKTALAAALSNLPDERAV